MGGLLAAGQPDYAAGCAWNLGRRRLGSGSATRHASRWAEGLELQAGIL